MSLRDAVYSVLVRDLGPAAGPFLERQCKLRLGKSPDQLVKADIPTLAKWVQIGTALILGDPIGAKLAHQVKMLG
jgi:hypothetical protein